ncbi:MAG TPA: SDR family NAD(P)-dependent oxidoreductase [Acidimicrobiales bacterium]|nr:SDR family NAD(P)-dependent oxidoreductase [Acidimicrobiales bacterium]
MTRVALVTGAASGIGWAVAERLAADGAAVVGFDLRPEGPPGVEVVAGDVTDRTAVDGVVAHVVATHGRLDVVANVAGVPQFGRVDDLSDAEWQRSLDVNLTGPFMVCRAALPHLRATKGCVVNVASIAGLEGQAYTAAYCASKGGLVLLTRALAVELALDGVRVNCVCPAAVDTPLLAEVAPRIPADADHRLLDRLQMLMPGLVTPGQVAAAVAYLASDDAGLITGQALALDGGRSA